MGILSSTLDESKPRLTAAAKEARHKLTIQEVLDDRTQADVAEFLGVHPITVAKWMKAYRTIGEAALAAKSVIGRPRANARDSTDEGTARTWITQDIIDMLPEVLVNQQLVELDAFALPIATAS